MSPAATKIAGAAAALALAAAAALAAKRPEAPGGDLAELRHDLGEMRRDLTDHLQAVDRRLSTMEGYMAGQHGAPPPSAAEAQR